VNEGEENREKEEGSRWRMAGIDYIFM